MSKWHWAYTRLTSKQSQKSQSYTGQRFGLLDLHNQFNARQHWSVLTVCCSLEKHIRWVDRTHFICFKNQYKNIDNALRFHAYIFPSQCGSTTYSIWFDYSIRSVLIDTTSSWADRCHLKFHANVGEHISNWTTFAHWKNSSLLFNKIIVKHA